MPALLPQNKNSQAPATLAQTGPLTLPLTQQVIPPLNPLQLYSVSMPSVSFSDLD